MQITLRKGPARAADLGKAHHILKNLSDAADFVLVVDKGARRRTNEQNRLQHLWHMEAAVTLKDESAEDKRAYCKLHFGVPILRAESDEFRAQYDAIIRPLPYEQKLTLMKAPIDFPVTRLMTVEQESEYLDRVRQHYMSQGVMLTLPEVA